MTTWFRSRRMAAATAVIVLAAVLVGAPPAQAAIPGLTMVSANSGESSAAVKWATVICPSGKKVIGSGWSLGGVPGGEVHVAEVRLTDNSVRVVAYEAVTGFTGDWYVRTEAVCATAPPGWELVVVSGDASSTGWRVEEAACPAGKQLLGGGAEISGGGGEVLLTSVIPASGAILASADENRWGTTTIWSLTVYAVCAEPLPGHEIVSEQTTSTSADKQLTTACPAGKRVLSGGASLYPDYGAVSIHHVRPGSYQGSEFVAVRATEDDTGTSSSWLVHAFAVCVAA
ncbi:hypothetical protein [Luedemannella helvata]|uniref:Uncharacterized protein n=1 Tax=Luedemannella helvata TaxID=349315 RepID=A0ABP4X913_9ACTN